jgi:hypothetical protein
MLNNPKYKKPDKDGRKPETWPPIPFENGRRIPRYLTDAVEDWLITKRGATRGMPIAAPLLVLVCAIHEAGHWFPVRSRLARALGTGEGWDEKKGEIVWKPYSIDAALSSALGNDEISERYETELGEVESRASIRRHRYLVPSPELLSVYRAAEKRHERARLQA